MIAERNVIVAPWRRFREDGTVGPGGGRGEELRVALLYLYPTRG